MTTTGNHTAPKGQIYVCSACGKRSRDRYGTERLDRLWDASCMMYAVLCYDDNPQNEMGKWRVVPKETEDAGVAKG